MENQKKRARKEENLWTDECEALLAEWSEKASCYRWLHGRCEKSYRTWYYCFSIPVIILSTLTGAANVGMDSFVPAESKSIASAIVGGVNIFAGIVSTLQNFLKVAELMEGHRIAGVSWGKLQRNIAIELALDPSRRVLQGDFLKLARAEYDRLIEAGPIIDDGIIKQFNYKFKNYEVSVPSICNGLDKCNIYKIDPKVKMDQEEFIDGIEDIVSGEEKVTFQKKDKINEVEPRELVIKKIDSVKEKVVDEKCLKKCVKKCDEKCDEKCLKKCDEKCLKKCDEKVEEVIINVTEEGEEGEEGGEELNEIATFLEGIENDK
tara:strand:- start:2922 stop:3881 length:960 start_codon:yes stop_codon:yes gene_type:complete